MTTTVQLRQLTLEPFAGNPRDLFTGNDQMVSSTLQLTVGNTAHLMPIDDTISLLVALLSTLPYRAHGQDLNVSRTPTGAVRLTLIGREGVRVTTEVPYQTWYSQVRGLVAAVVTHLSDIGEGPLASPLIAVLNTAD